MNTLDSLIIKTTQTEMLWELLSNHEDSIIESLIYLFDVERVIEIFGDDYTDYCQNLLENSDVEPVMLRFIKMCKDKITVKPDDYKVCPLCAVMSVPTGDMCDCDRCGQSGCFECISMENETELCFNCHNADDDDKFAGYNDIMLDYKEDTQYFKVADGGNPDVDYFDTLDEAKAFCDQHESLDYGLIMCCDWEKKEIGDWGDFEDKMTVKSLPCFAKNGVRCWKCQDCKQYIEERT